MTAFIEGARALFSSALTPHSFHLTTAHPFFSSRDQNVNRRALVTLFPSVIFYNSRNADRIDTVFRKIQNLMFRLGGDPRRRPEARKRVVVLGTGWGAMNFINRIDVTKYDVIIISPRNYFAFTPLLPSVSSGTVSARSTLEPVRNKLMRGGKKVMDFHEAWAVHVSDSQKSVTCQTATGTRFEVPYDYLVVSVGAEINTFGVPGVFENAHFLKEVEHARRIHKSVLDNFERASIPGTSEAEKKRLLHFVIVGGGPSGVEVAAEISDFVNEDARRHFPELVSHVKVTLIEMLPKVLPMFQEQVSEYTLELMKKRGIETLMKTRVTKISDKAITIADSKNKSHEIPYGFVLWASGTGNLPFVRHLLSTIQAQKGNRVMKVNERLQLIGMPGVYAMGDCSIFSPKPIADDAVKIHKMANGQVDWLEKNKLDLESEYPQIASFEFQTLQSQKGLNLTMTEFRGVLEKIDKAFRPPPPTAQNATQEARYLAGIFNRCVEDDKKDEAPAYVYRWRGSMAYVGEGNSVVETPQFTRMGGRISLLLWRYFYWSNQMSCNNKFILISDWLRTFFYGRDVGRDHTNDGLPPTPQL